MRKNVNRVNLQGYVWGFNLEVKTGKTEGSKMFGKQYINGTLEVAVDEACLNVIPVYFSCVTPEFGISGKTNATYGVLEKIINENKTVQSCGKDGAMKIKVDTALGVNDFINKNDEMISVKRCDGGFVSFVDALPEEDKRNEFTMDMLILNATRTEADPERHIDRDYVTVKGFVFNYTNAILPADFRVYIPQGMEYFENAEPSKAEPLYTQLSGYINCSTIKEQREEESAFGEARVITTERKTREWVVKWAKPTPYEIGEDITKEEFAQAMADRELVLANVKKRDEEYKASKNNSGNVFTATPAATPVTPKSSGAFVF